LLMRTFPFLVIARILTVRIVRHDGTPYPYRWGDGRGLRGDSYAGSTKHPWHRAHTPGERA
jgi:hypothetical protein